MKKSFWRLKYKGNSHSIPSPFWQYPEHSEIPFMSSAADQPDYYNF